MLWAILGAMVLVAIAAIVVPLYRSQGTFSATASGVTVVIALGSVLLYQSIGQPEARLVPAGAPNVDDMVTSLAERLDASPEDVAGWKMLGRSYLVMRRYSEAIGAYERAVALENPTDPQTLADLGEAVFLDDNTTLLGRAGQLFENALALAPANPKALFYSGLAAAQRGDTSLAADRWETLLATAPPPEIEELLRQRVAEWRGESPAPAAPAAAATADGGPLTINVSLGGSALSAVAPGSTIFIIARDPAQPSPPIAAVRRRANELPSAITLSDADAMIPGRLLSGFDKLEIVARASTSGQPMAQSGDWFGSAELDTDESRQLSIVIDQQVP